MTATNLINQISIQKPKTSFWALNIGGWTMMTLLNILFQTQYFSTNFNAVYYSFFVTSLGFLMSILVRYVILKFNLIEFKFVALIPILIFNALIFSVLTVLFYSWLIYIFFPEKEFNMVNFIGNVFNFNLVFLIWTFIYASFLFFEQQKKLAEQKLNLSLQLKEAELNNLRKQLSPHFFFNAINNIRSLILIEPEKARDALLNVSDLLRYALNYQKNTSVTVAEEMEVVEGYINLNQIHLGDKVEFKLNIHESLKDLSIPPMSIQLLVENAIKHGHLSHGAIVEVNVTSTKTHQLIQVKNPGHLKPSHRDGIGLSNLMQRLQSMYQNRAEFSIFENNEMVNAEIKIK